MKYLLTLLIAFFLLKEANADVCFPPELKKDFERSDVVFKGKVIAVAKDSNLYFEGDLRHPTIYTFLVDVKWKGSADLITQLMSVGSYDDGFLLDSTYIVFANGYRIYNSYCSNTEIISKARKQIEFLGEGKNIYRPENISELIRLIKEGPIKPQVIKNEPKEEYHYNYLISGIIGLIILAITFYLGRMSRKS